jgi:alcohol dehydrogenase YqhD (iron-dependent ADH family)
VLTLPATGSEMNLVPVIEATKKEKLTFGGSALFPKFHMTQ